MPPRNRIVFAALSVVLFCVAAAPLVGELARRSDIWWTPRPMLVPLEKSTDRVEIYARGKRLEPLLQAGEVRIVEEGGASTLQTSDVGLRFNNRDRARIERLPLLLLCAAMCGVAACLLILALTGSLAYRGEKSRRA